MPLTEKWAFFSYAEVLNSSPPPPCSAYFACLSLLTHLIQIISLLEVRSMHELPIDMLSTQGPLLPTP